jgi:prepilin-type N-terminal cleavage/methylation domain-containing protein/prepilin-type processing-associated H-X9-DG protein
MMTMRTRHETAPESHTRSRPGFTLLELLVVVAIIALLMSILTPSLARARQQAKSTVCMTRLAEFLKGLTAYSSDNRFGLPPMWYPVDPNQPNGPRHGWAEALYAYMYNDKDFSHTSDFPVLRNQEDRFELWVCKEGMPIAGSTGHYRVYEISWIRGSLDLIKPRWPVIMDANPRVTYPNDVRLSWIPREHIAGLEGEAYIDERHYGGANYVFNDGHAERQTGLKEKLALDWDLDPNTPNQ